MAINAPFLSSKSSANFALTAVCADAANARQTSYLFPPPVEDW